MDTERMELINWFERVSPRNRNCLHLVAQIGLGHRVIPELSRCYREILNETWAGNTPLHVACLYGHWEVVAALLQLNKVHIQGIGAEQSELVARTLPVDVNAKDGRSQTPLHVAVLCGHLEIVKLLCEVEDVELNAKTNYYEETPLHLAIDRRLKCHLELVKHLSATPGLDVNSKDLYRQTPLHLAAKKGYLSVVEHLSSTASVDIQAQDRFGRTPLHLAAKEGSLAVVKHLCKTAGVDDNARDRRRRTAIHLAARAGREEVVKFLCTNHGVQVAARPSVNLLKTSRQGWGSLEMWHLADSRESDIGSETELEYDANEWETDDDYDSESDSEALKSFLRFCGIGSEDSVRALQSTLDLDSEQRTWNQESEPLETWAEISGG